MKRTDIHRVVEDAAQLGRGTVRGHEVLAALEGWDSLSSIEFQMLVEERWGIDLGGTAVVKCVTVADLVALLGDQVEA